MEQGYGGPVWHASIAHHGRRAIPLGGEHLARAERALHNIGDPMHEWRRVGISAAHLRRRLSLDEQAATGLVMRDIRGTAEAASRLDAVRRWLPDGYVE
jgi:hypothetical protein